MPVAVKMNAWNAPRIAGNRIQSWGGGEREARTAGGIKLSQEQPPKSLVFDHALVKEFINGNLQPEVEDRVAAHLGARPELVAKIAAVSGDRFIQRLKHVQQRFVAAQSRLEPTALAAGRVDAIAARQQTQVAVATNESEIAKHQIEFPGYEIIKELGRGGMGVVYLAKNIEMDRLEVLKVLSDRLFNNPGAEQRFKQEIRAVSKLNHSNIVISYNILRTQTQMAFAMEYVHGMDLHKFIHKQQILPIGLACSLARQIAAGLQHAHEKGLVHRDIKPSNAILYKSDGQLLVKILDFGLAKATSEKSASGLTQDGTMLGTPEYMAPEQMLNAAKADIRADIYSLGCTLYHMLAGKAPFGGTQGEIMMAHAQQAAPAVNLVRAHVPVELAAIIAMMMAKDPSNRFQTPSQVSTALLPFVNHPEVTADLDDASVRSAANTIHEPNVFQRDTSVENVFHFAAVVVPSIEPVSLPSQFANLIEDSHLNLSPAAQSRRLKIAKKGISQWWKPIAVIAPVLISFALWQLDIVDYKTSDGTIVIYHMPLEAEVIVDGKSVEVVWNEDQDQAQVTVNPGRHGFQIVNQGNRIFAQMVRIQIGERRVVKLALSSNASTIGKQIGDDPSYRLSPNGEWVDLLAMVQLPDDAVLGAWSLTNGVLSCAESWNATCLLPAVVRGSYEIECSFVRRAGNEAIFLFIPLDKTSCTLALGGWAGRSHSLNLVDGKDGNSLESATGAAFLPGMLTNSQAYKVSVIVKQDKGKVSIQATLNGQEIISWSGTESQLSPVAWNNLNNPSALGVAVSSGIADFQEIRFRVLPDPSRKDANLYYHAYKLGADWLNPVTLIANRPKSAVWSNFKEWNGNRYFISDDPMPVTSAQCLAKKLGGRLLTVSSDAENEFISSEGKGKWIWMAGHRTSHDFQWRDERNRPLRYIGKFGPNQPENSELQTQLVLITGDDPSEGWHDCDFTWPGHGYACIEWGEEYPVNP